MQSNEYKDKYTMCKKKYILLKYQKGGKYNIDDFIETTNHNIKEYLKNKGYRNVYVVRKVFLDTGDVLAENVDSLNKNLMDMNDTKLLEIDDKNSLLSELRQNKNKQEILRQEQEISEQKQEILRQQREKVIIENIVNNYYLATESRYNKPLDTLLPFGSFQELEDLYNRSNPDEVTKIKNMSVAIPDAQIVGTSQYGIYFRLVKKDDVVKYHRYSSDAENFNPGRSFLFDFKTFLEYIASQQNGVPLFFYANRNAYGYEQYSSSRMDNNNYNKFLSKIIDLEEKLYEHEFVCRIPIPLNAQTGFLGKINFGILSLGLLQMQQSKQPQYTQQPKKSQYTQRQKKAQYTQRPKKSQ